MTTQTRARSVTPGIVSPLYSETHSEGQIGYREWARKNGRLGDIHAIDDRYDIDELMAYLIERTGRRMYWLPRSPCWDSQGSIREW